MMLCPLRYLSFFFFNDTATTEIYTLSLHDALPILPQEPARAVAASASVAAEASLPQRESPPPNTQQMSQTPTQDRKSTRLNSSHSQISYAVFCLKKKKKPK